MSTPIGFDNAGRPIFPTVVTNEQLEAARRAESERITKAVERRKADEAAHRAEQARLAHEAGAAELEAFRRQAHAAWLSSGGDEAGFAANWPTLRDEHLREAAMSRMGERERLVEQEKAALRASGRYSM
jgi:hypothetical protein